MTKVCLRIYLQRDEKTRGRCLQGYRCVRKCYKPKNRPKPGVLQEPVRITVRDTSRGAGVLRGDTARGAGGLTLTEDTNMGAGGLPGDTNRGARGPPR